MFSPPTSLPSLLNPTSMAGHRQPIKPGLGGYLHTLGCSEKFLNTPAPARPLHRLLFTDLLRLSFPPSFTLFHLLPCLFPSFASSIQSPHPGSSSHNGGVQKLLILLEQTPSGSCPPPPLCSGSCAFCCYDNEMCSITVTKLCVSPALCGDDGGFMWIHAPSHVSAPLLDGNLPFGFHDHKPDFHLPPNVK